PRSSPRGPDHLQVPWAAAAAQLRLVLGGRLMGLFVGLLTLPLAPIRGTVWIAEKLAEEAARERDEGRRIRRELSEAELAYERGEQAVEELELDEADVLDQLRRAGGRDASDCRQ